MLVSPSKGTFHQSEGVGQDIALSAGTIVGEVTNLRGSTPVAAPHGGTVVEWIVEDGDLVSPGQPLVRLHPESE
jgi:[acyl-carrier-protein] S-malonyltransferase